MQILRAEYCFGKRVERAARFELATSSLGSWHSTTELRPPVSNSRAAKLDSQIGARVAPRKRSDKAAASGGYRWRYPHGRRLPIITNQPIVDSSNQPSVVVVTVIIVVPVGV